MLERNCLELSRWELVLIEISSVILLTMEKKVSLIDGESMIRSLKL